MRIRLNAAGLTDVGREREHNEDAIFYLVTRDERDEPLGMFIVADGVGGQLAGEIASQWAVAAVRDALRDLFAPPDKMQTQPVDNQRTPMLKPVRTDGG
ncbi:MAG TPA: protein phosphatase 2C domain-containing protein, partial [Anaerolineae bacterium]